MLIAVTLLPMPLPIFTPDWRSDTSTMNNNEQHHTHINR